MKSLLDKFKEDLLNAKIVDAKSNYGSSMVWLPDGMKIRNIFVNEVRKICSNYSIEEYLFPTIASGDEFNNITNKIYDFSKHVFWLDDNRLLRPSGESVIYPYFRQWLKASRILPIKVYQIGTSYRKGRARGIFKANEADLFIEGHTAHLTHKEALEQLEVNINIVKKILEFMGLPVIITHRPLWNNNPVGEIIVGFDTLLPTGETLLVGSAYSQNQIFSKAFDVNFIDKKNQKRNTYQTSFGFSSRLIFASLMLSADDRGFNILPQIAPKQVVILPIINKNNKEKIIKYAINIKNILLQNGYRVEIDNSNENIGKKRHNYEFSGVPIIIEIGNKELEANTITIIPRYNNIKLNCSIEELNTRIHNILEEATKSIKDRIKNKHNKNIIEHVELSEELTKTIDDGKVANFSLCCNEKCSKYIEQEVRGEVIGYIENFKENKCIVCGNLTKYKAYQARHI